MDQVLWGADRGRKRRTSVFVGGACHSRATLPMVADVCVFENPLSLLKQGFYVYEIEFRWGLDDGHLKRTNREQHACV